MHPFDGVEPLVGEVVGLRTFRVDESGLLLPLYSDKAWYGGANTAECAPPTGDGRRRPHRVADPSCECGFYAYSSVEAASHNRQSRFVLAVVSCWGAVTAGTQGVRAEHARIDALWLAPGVPKWVRTRVALSYPGVPVHSTVDAMLAEHPLTVLPCYDRLRVTKQWLGRGAYSALAGALLVAGLLPGEVAAHHVGWWALLVLLLGYLGLLAVLPIRGRGALAVVVTTWLAWLVAPLFGLWGWALRLPLLQGILIMAWGRVRSVRPGYFPVVATVRERAFCGVRP